MRSTAALPLSLLLAGGTLAAQDAHAPITVVQGSRRGRLEKLIVEPQTELVCSPTGYNHAVHSFAKP
jgi:hypothetical protein